MLATTDTISAGEDVENLDWRPRLLELILSDESVTEQRHINWKVKKHFGN